MTDPTGVPDERPEDTGTEADVAAREAAAWQAIVDNYGEHPAFDEPPAPAAAPVDPEPPPRAGPSRLDLDDPPGPATSDPEDHFVPPPPPRVPLASPPRLLAWLGLFGVPVLSLVALVVGVTLPQWLSVLFMAWFVGGFVFLVASMRPGPRDDHDDGARL